MTYVIVVALCFLIGTFCIFLCTSTCAVAVVDHSEEEGKETVFSGWRQDKLPNGENKVILYCVVQDTFFCRSFTNCYIHKYWVSSLHMWNLLVLEIETIFYALHAGWCSSETFVVTNFTFLFIRIQSGGRAQSLGSSEILPSSSVQQLPWQCLSLRLGFCHTFLSCFSRFVRLYFFYLEFHFMFYVFFPYFFLFLQAGTQPRSGMLWLVVLALGHPVAIFSLRRHCFLYE